MAAEHQESLREEHGLLRSRNIYFNISSDICHLCVLADTQTGILVKLGRGEKFP